MREFLNVRRVPPTLKGKIQRFYATAARHQVLQDDDVIHHLSTPLRTELVLFLYRNTLEKVPFFQVHCAFITGAAYTVHSRWMKSELLCNPRQYRPTQLC
jgi:hypothetical protein